MIRWINIALFLVALYGAYLAVREEQLRRELSVQHQRFANEVGYLDITDPDKVHVVALPSEDPLHFCIASDAGGAAWRAIMLTTGVKEPSHTLPTQADVPQARWLTGKSCRIPGVFWFLPEVAQVRRL